MFLSLTCTSHKDKQPQDESPPPILSKAALLGLWYIINIQCTRSTLIEAALQAQSISHLVSLETCLHACLWDIAGLNKSLGAPEPTFITTSWVQRNAMRLWTLPDPWWAWKRQYKLTQLVNCLMKHSEWRNTHLYPVKGYCKECKGSGGEGPCLQRKINGSQWLSEDKSAVSNAKPLTSLRPFGRYFSLVPTAEISKIHLLEIRADEEVDSGRK